jgi:hypothetical protein
MKAMLRRLFYGATRQVDREAARAATNLRTAGVPGTTWGTLDIWDEIAEAITNEAENSIGHRLQWGAPTLPLQDMVGAAIRQRGYGARLSREHVHPLSHWLEQWYPDEIGIPRRRAPPLEPVSFQI